jgi:hypothetical protein
MQKYKNDQDLLNLNENLNDRTRIHWTGVYTHDEGLHFEVCWGFFVTNTSKKCGSKVTAGLTNAELKFTNLITGTRAKTPLYTRKFLKQCSKVGGTIEPELSRPNTCRKKDE